MTFSGWVSTLAGWFVTEIGRQPFLVYGLLRTADLVADHPPGMVLSTLIAYLTVYTFLLAWNEFLFAVVLIESWENRVLTMAIYSLMAEFVTEWNTMMAFSVLASLPLVIAFIFLQKIMVQGMTAGALTS